MEYNGLETIERILILFVENPSLLKVFYTFCFIVFAYFAWAITTEIRKSKEKSYFWKIMDEIKEIHIKLARLDEKADLFIQKY